ncbi:hypothetical protein GDO86_008508 [Hymenochirus boettgeri]|uniref:Uncharacterized protein n=1 Tax=Hymenochirus boettgeri TaxID=247094 RepID=A0A8T2IXU7_9PIPI|nr:hypothetical protein GDO86_008508 [Hymenochirus boettgeri]
MESCQYKNGKHQINLLSKKYADNHLYKQCWTHRSCKQTTNILVVRLYFTLIFCYLHRVAFTVYMMFHKCLPCVSILVGQYM